MEDRNKKEDSSINKEADPGSNRLKETEVVISSNNKEEEKADSSLEKKEKKGFFSRFKKLRHKELILAVVAILVMLIIYFTGGFRIFGCGGNSSASGNNQNNSQTGAQSENFLTRIERQLNETLSRIQGAGRTQVVINWESSVEIVIAYIINEGQNSSSKAPQIVAGGPIILREIYPRARGVVVVTQGGDSPRVRFEMIQALTTLLEITADRVQVIHGS